MPVQTHVYMQWLIKACGGQYTTSNMDFPTNKLWFLKYRFFTYVFNNHCTLCKSQFYLASEILTTKLSVIVAWTFAFRVSIRVCPCVPLNVQAELKGILEVLCLNENHWQKLRVTIMLCLQPPANFSQSSFDWTSVPHFEKKTLSLSAILHSQAWDGSKVTVTLTLETWSVHLKVKVNVWKIVMNQTKRWRLDKEKMPLVEDLGA